MLIDWFTVIAQIINFVVLVLLLKYFLYDRIIEAMDRREAKIRKRLEEADSKRKEADQEAESYRRKNEEIDRKGNEMLSKAKQEAEQERKSLTKKAREEVEEIRDKWHQSVLNEQSAFLRDLRELTANQVYAISRRALQDLADVKLEQQLVGVFLSEIQNISKEKRHKIAETIKSQEHAVTVKSSFKLPAKFRRKITETVHRSLTKNAELNYEIDSDIIMGIELKSGGEKVAWNLENYLNSLEQHVKEALERKRQN